MSRINLKSLIALSSMTIALNFNSTSNTAYSDLKEKQRAEHVKALSKKQRVREQIRARRKELRK